MKSGFLIFFLLTLGLEPIFGVQAAAGKAQKKAAEFQVLLNECQPRDVGLPMLGKQHSWFVVAGLVAPAMAGSGRCDLRFPEDHGPHPGFQTEWWYVTGHLRDSSGRLFGFQVTFFRNRFVSDAEKLEWPASPSRWRADTLMMVHSAVTDIQRKRFVYYRDTARVALDLAGWRREDDRIHLFLKKNRWTLFPDGQNIRVVGPRFRLELSFAPERPPVLHGDKGYSRKGSTPDRASCYYSFTRMAVRGRIILDESDHPVQGTAWMDHEFTTAPLEPDIVGWDWFGLRLSHGKELMIYSLRKTDGSIHPASQGTLVLEDGRSVTLSRKDFRIQVTGRWKSPHTGALYPSGWRIWIPAFGLDLRVVPLLRDQELRGSSTDPVDYWEGAVSVQGIERGSGVRFSGEGYVELTGYAEPLIFLQNR